MANWYISSVAYAAVPQWAVNHTYAPGSIVRQLATPVAGEERCFRTAAGRTLWIVGAGLLGHDD